MGKIIGLGVIKKVEIPKEIEEKLEAKDKEIAELTEKLEEANENIKKLEAKDKKAKEEK